MQSCEICISSSSGITVIAASDAQKERISEEILANLTAAEEKLESLKQQEALDAAKADAIDRLNDYADAKALSDATPDEQASYTDTVNDEIVKINAATTTDAVAAALTAAKQAVDGKLAEIRQARADAEAEAKAAAEMAAANEALEAAKNAAATAQAEVANTKTDAYISKEDKDAIETAEQTLSAALENAEKLSTEATADEKNAAAKAIEDAVTALDAATDTANVNIAVAKLEEATEAAQLEAAKKTAVDRLND